ncbi:MAG: hypothetical protein ACTHQM_06630 [Thermoanaerobaculia bacterium]
MKRTLIFAALLLCSALPLMAQGTSELGVIVGGSRRFIEGGPEHLAGDFIESNFGLSNNAIDLYWSMELEPQLNFKIRGGRVETQIATPYDDTVTENGQSVTRTFRRDVEGEMQHIEGVVEYRFSEAFGSSGLFGGVGYYRQSPDEGDSQSGYGFVGGVNADFPISRRYGVVVEGAYHWTNGDFNSRYMTLGGGLRVRF